MAQREKDELYEKLVNIFDSSAEFNGLLPLLEKSIQAMIELEFDKYIGAERYERSTSRLTMRNGYRTRNKPFRTGLGEVDIRIPRVRKGNYYPDVLERYQRVDRALISVIQEAYINGVSTRKMEKVFSRIGITGLDKSSVSRYIQPIRDEVEKWRSRRLSGHYAYIWLDAIHSKVRRDGAVFSTSILIAKALRFDGHREVLGFYVGNKESYHNWKSFLQDLKFRGLDMSSLWIRDDHDGLLKALSECFPGQLQQRCIVHWMRNALDKVSGSHAEEWLKGLLSPLVQSVDVDSFESARGRLLEQISAKGYDKLYEWLEDTLPEVSTYILFPLSHWTKIKSTNPLERLNEEIRRRERCVRIFPSEGSCILLIGAVLQEQSETWTTGRIYLQRDLDKAKNIMERLNTKIAKVA